MFSPLSFAFGLTLGMSALLLAYVIALFMMDDGGEK